MSPGAELKPTGETAWSMDYVRRQLIRGADAPDVSSAGGMFTSFNYSVLPLDSLWHTEVSVLLGDPGAGKTSTIQQQLTPNRGVQVYDLGTYEDTRQLEELFRGTAFRQGTPAQPALVVFDSYDECRLATRTLPGLIVRELLQLPTDNSWRLCVACRHTEWDFTVQRELARASRSFETFQLAPLEWEAVMEQARRAGVDRDAFFDFVRANDLTPFVARPMTLELLLQSFRDGGATVPTKQDLFEKQCLRLCSESSERRRRQTPQEVSDGQILDLASRVAATLLLSDRRFACSNPSHSDRAECLAVGDLVATEAPPWKVPPKLPEIRESLKVALFTLPEGEHIRVREASVRDYLAARWLLRSNFEVPQILDLAMHSIPGARPKVRPQLRAAVGWLVGRMPGLTEALIDGNVDVVLRADLSEAPADTKQRTVAALLTDWATDDRGTIAPEWRLETLGYDGLATQLTGLLASPATTRLGRRLALRMGRDCRASDLDQVAVSIALDNAQPPSVRAEAVRTVAAFGRSVAALIELLKSDFPDEPGQALRDALMRALWPTHIDAATLFGAIRLPDAVISHYHSFLSSTLAKGLTDDGLPAALDWVDTLPESYRLDYTSTRLFEQVLRMAWSAAAERSALLPRLARTVFKRLLLDDFHHGTSPVRELWISDQKTRRAVLEEIASLARPDEVADNALWSYGHPDDLDWILERVSRDRDTGRVQFWAQLMVGAFRLDQAAAGPAVFDVMEVVPELRVSLGHWFQAVELVSADADNMRQQLAFDQRRAERAEPPSNPGPGEIFLTALAAGEPPHDLWFRYSRIPAASWQPSDEEPARESVWKDLPEADRTTLVAGAVAFLHEFNPGTRAKLKHNTFTLGESAGVLALRFLMSRAPDSMPLDQPTVSRWRFPAVRAAGNLEAGEAELARLLVWFKVRHADALRRDILYQFGLEAKAGSVWVLSRLAGVWDEALQDKLLGMIDSVRHPLAGFEALLAELIPRGVVKAHQLASAWFESLLSQTPPSKGRLRRGVVAGRLLMKNDLCSVWPTLSKLLDERPAAARACVRDLAVTTRDNLDLTGLSEDQLMELYRFLYLDQPVTVFQGQDDAVQVARLDLRDLPLAELQRRGTEASYRALSALALQFPQSPRLASIAESAADVWAFRAWIPPPPSSILRMADDPSRRSVSSPERLADTVAASIKSWAEQLQVAPPTVFTLWDRRSATIVAPKEEAALSDVLAKHLSSDLRKRITVAREDQLSRILAERYGEFGDLIVRAPDTSGNGTEHALAVEVKGVWNDGLVKDLRRQLVDRYMQRLHTPVGLYVVGDFDSPNWKDRRKTQADRHRRGNARAALDLEAAALDRELRVTVVWLDLQLP